MQRVCIGFNMQNEADWLRLHLPVLAQANIPLVAVDGGSHDDSPAVAASFGAKVGYYPYRWDNGASHNALIDLARRLGYHVMIHLAPDELMHPHDLVNIVTMMQRPQVNAVGFRRLNFMRDRRHYAPDKPYYPDTQWRVWRLLDGVRFDKRFHGRPDFSRFAAHTVIVEQSAHIYHYEGLKPMPYRALKALNKERIGQGLPALDALPDGHAVPEYPHHIPYEGKQPLDPDAIGDRAPLSAS